MTRSMATTKPRVTTKPMTVIAPDNSKMWLCNGLLHRVDGPAREFADGGKQWWLNGNLHRVDGPAVDTPVMKAWYKDHKLHRVDGPALIRCGLYSDWWVHGRQLTEEEFMLYVDQLTGEVFIPPGKKLKYEDLVNNDYQ